MAYSTVYMNMPAGRVSKQAASGFATQKSSDCLFAVLFQPFSPFIRSFFGINPRICSSQGLTFRDYVGA